MKSGTKPSRKKVLKKIGFTFNINYIFEMDKIMFPIHESGNHWWIGSIGVANKGIKHKNSIQECGNGWEVLTRVVLHNRNVLMYRLHTLEIH